MKHASIFSLIFLVILVCSSFADWTLYRYNADANAIVTKTSLPIELETIWERTIDAGVFQATAIIGGDTVFVGSGEAGFYAFALETGEEKWHVKLDVLASAAYFKSSNIPTSMPNEIVCFGDVDGTVHALDAKTGNAIWTFKTEGEINGAPNIDTKNNRILISSQDGNLYAIDIQTGKLAWKYTSGDQIRSFPSIAETNMRFCFISGCDGFLHVINLDDGVCVRKIQLDAPTGSTPVVYEDLLFFGTEGNELLAIDWKTGKIKWRFETKNSVRAPTVCKDGIVVFGGFDRTIYAIDIETKDVKWTLKTKSKAESGGVIVQNRLYIPSYDGLLYVIDFKTGEKLASVELSGKVTASPAVEDGKLIIGTENGILKCLGKK